MSGPAGATGGTLVFVASVDDAPAPRRGLTVVALDLASIAAPAGRPDILPWLAFAAERPAATDVSADALAALDAWADRVGVIESLTLDGVSYWYRLREDAWRWLQEQMLWEQVMSHALDELAPRTVVAPGADEPLADVIAALGRRRGIDVQIRASGPGPGIAVASPPSDERPSAPRAALAMRLFALAGPLARRTRRRGEGPAAGAATASREALLARRIAMLTSGEGRMVLVLVYARLLQRRAQGAARMAEDPNLGAVIARLAAAGHRPVVIAIGLDHRRDLDWESIRADQGMLPESLLRVRWRPSDEPDPAIVEPLRERIRNAATSSLSVASLDVAPALVAWIDRRITTSIFGVIQQAARAGSLMGELRPKAVLLTHEGIRQAWLRAARDWGIPTVAVQHGVLYPAHPGYCYAPDSRRLLPDVTCVYGPYERDVLLQHCGYGPEHVLVSGSPRLGTVRPAEREAPAEPGERLGVRRELGVAEGDRMLVISTGFLPMYRRFTLIPMLMDLFGGPLPGIHLVFKQHPGEADEGPYRGVVEELARRGGFSPPRVTVVRDIDLYRLLRAADAHLGVHSTVLTDAVAAGTPNLLFTGRPGGDFLGYVAARVARPVRDHEELLAALADPPRPTREARAAFLARHFREGDAVERIMACITALDGGIEDLRT